MLTSCVAVCSLLCSQNWSSLATCLGMDSNKTSSDDILRFIHRRGYMIVPPSNPPTQDQGSRKNLKRSIHSGKCPFTYAVIDFIDTVPRFVSNATCSGCDVVARRSPTPWGFFAGIAAIIGYGRSETFKLHIFWKFKMKRTTVMEKGSNNSSKRSRSC